MISFNKDAVYDVVVPTSMGVRITPFGHMPVEHSTTFSLQVTSAESNVITPIASLGMRTKVLTALVNNSPIATTIKGDLMRRGIEVDSMSVDQNGPWGIRHQINIADSGYGVRGPRVYNDRTGEVGQLLDAQAFDLDQLFVKDGVKIIHLSGLIVSLSPSTAAFCKTLVKKAKQHNTRISFDLNYRQSFWTNRTEELRPVFDYIARHADILIGNEEDFQSALGIVGPDIKYDNLNDSINHYQDMMKLVQSTYPSVSIIATTLREVIDANTHLWGAVLYSNTFMKVLPKPISVLDRIGGGDGFVGGLLYSLLQNHQFEDALHFGWAMGAYTCSLNNDFAEPSHEQQIWNVWNGIARIDR